MRQADPASHAGDDMALALTALIEDATARAGALNAAATREAIQGIREPAAVLERRIEGAAHALDMAEARALHAQGLLERASRHLAEAHAVERRMEELAGARLAWLESRLAQITAQHEQTLRTAEEAARARAEALVADLAARLDTVQSRGDVLAAGLDDLACKADAGTDALASAASARDQLTSAALDATRSIERALETREALRAEVGILTQRVRALQGELTGAVQDARQTLSIAQPDPATRSRRRRAA